MVAMRRLLSILAVPLLAMTACGDGPRDLGAVATTVAPSSTSPSTSTSTSISTTTTTPARTTTTARTNTTARAQQTTTPTASGPAVVDSGTSQAGAWQLVAERGERGLLCARLRVRSQDAGGVCNEASEQDFNGNDTLRYSGALGEPFVIGVGLPTVARVRAELVGGVVVERATVAAPFTTAARFVALPLPANAGIRHLVALDSGGRELTRIPINP